MLGAFGLAAAMRPTRLLADQAAVVDLRAMIPMRFGDWGRESGVTAGVVTPQSRELESQLYSQVLTGTYVNDLTGDRIMLSIAYGRDQSDSRSPHLPDVCYPSQGFQILDVAQGVVDWGGRTFPVRHLDTARARRHEPVTYWVTVGNTVARTRLDMKLAQLAYRFRGEIPDGLVFRVSSISPDARSAFLVQAQFVKALLTSVTPDARMRLAGLDGSS
jgi:EpsI family protein